VVSIVPHLKTRSIAAGWARDDREVQVAAQRYGSYHDDVRLFITLLGAIMRLPLLPRTKASIFLVWLLPPGARHEVTFLQRLASDLRLKWRSVERSKHRLGIKSVRKAGHWYWWLP
jgi:hypothetical protein